MYWLLSLLGIGAAIVAHRRYVRKANYNKIKLLIEKGAKMHDDAIKNASYSQIIKSLLDRGG